MLVDEVSGEPTAVRDVGAVAPTGASRWRSRGRWLARRVVVAVVACTLVPLALLYVFQDQFVFFTGVDAVPPISSALPRARTVAYRTADGIALDAWFLPARTPQGGCARAATVLLFHGQNQSRASEAPLASALAERGVNVMLGEYRGFGGMDGTPSEDGLAEDARAALDVVRTQPEVDPGRVVVAGFSLGTGVAASLAAERPAAGLVLLAPYTSMPDMAWHRLPVLPYSLLLKARFDTVAHVAQTDTPVLVVASETDEVIPLAQSQQVHDAARHADALARVDGLSHTQVGEAPRTLAPITDFVARHAPCPS